MPLVLLTAIALAHKPAVHIPVVAVPRPIVVEIQRVTAGSLYDPWVVQLPDRYVMFRCQNTDNHDRVWRSESVNGISNWTDDRVAVEGEIGAQDDLSCSPGVVIAPDGTWHLYYATASRFSICSVEFWHATSLDGIVWVKLGKVGGIPASDCSMLMPSPIIEGDQIGLYFVQNSRLWRAESDVTDGHTFTSPSPIGSLGETRNARVTRVGNARIVAYSNVQSGEDTQTDEVFLAPGLDTPGGIIARATPGTFYSTFLSVGNYLPGPPARLYVSGNPLPRCVNHIGPCSDFGMAVGVILYP